MKRGRSIVITPAAVSGSSQAPTGIGCPSDPVKALTVQQTVPRPLLKRIQG